MERRVWRQEIGSVDAVFQGSVCFWGQHRHTKASMSGSTSECAQCSTAAVSFSKAAINAQPFISALFTKTMVSIQREGTCELMGFYHAAIKITTVT